MVTQWRKNVDDKTKVEAIERLLSNKKRLRASYVIIRKSAARMLQTGYVWLRKHYQLNYIFLANN
jgi:hypothetical protein